MQRSILIVEDDPTLSDVLESYLSDAGYNCKVIDDGLAVEAWFLTNRPDMVLLDVALPGINGIELCGKIRSFSNVPIIMVTGKAEEADRLRGLDRGADDYICKPFRPREVVARVGTIFRRVQPNFGLDDPQSEPARAQFYLDVKRLTLHFGSQQKLLTLAQCSLLAYLMEHEGQVVSRTDLISNLYDDENNVSERTIDSHIRELRKGISEILPREKVIFSIYGSGYKFEMPLL